MIYTAKDGLINVPKILKGTAMHCDSLPVKQVRDMVCTRVLTALPCGGPECRPYDFRIVQPGA